MLATSRISAAATTAVLGPANLTHRINNYMIILRDSGE